MTTTKEKIIDELSSICSASGLMKNVIKDMGYVPEGLEKNLETLASKLSTRSERLTELLNLGLLDNPRLKDPDISGVLSGLVSSAEGAIKKLAGAGIEKATDVVVKWIAKKLG